MQADFDDLVNDYTFDVCVVFKFATCWTFNRRKVAGYFSKHNCHILYNRLFV